MEIWKIWKCKNFISMVIFQHICEAALCYHGYLCDVYSQHNVLHCFCMFCTCSKHVSAIKTRNTDTWWYLPGRWHCSQLHSSRSSASGWQLPIKILSYRITPDELVGNRTSCDTPWHTRHIACQVLVQLLFALCVPALPVSPHTPVSTPSVGMAHMCCPSMGF